MSLKELTREALEVEVITLRKQIEVRAQELAKPQIEQAREAKDKYETYVKELEAEMAPILRMTIDAKLKAVRDMFAARQGKFFGSKFSYQNLKLVFNWEVAYYYDHLETALKSFK